MKARFVPAIATQSLGRTWHHSLEHKLRLCHQYGLGTLELFFEDLEGVANNLPSSHPHLPSGTSFPGSTEEQEKQIAASQYIHELCVQYQLEILCLQPFMHYDGLVDPASHKAAIEKLHFWIRLAHILDTDLIQIPSSFLPESQCSGSRDRIVADLREAADVGLRSNPPVRFVYEALCWGTHVDLWDVAWSIVMEVDRPNFGTCLDTFNLAGRVFADPASPTGMTPSSYEDTRETIAKLRSELPGAIEKVFYVEVCDGERLDQPLVPGHKWYHPEQKARMSWSRNARLFPFEERGYMPVLEILEAICDAGYRGPISFELFSESANQAGKDVPEKHARRAAIAWAKLEEHMHWNDSADVSCNASVSSSTPATSLSSSPTESKR